MQTIIINTKDLEKIESVKGLDKVEVTTIDGKLYVVDGVVNNSLNQTLLLITN